MSFPQTLTLKAFAKINLSLDITGILENGYHQLEMIMQSVSLHDKVTITTSDASQGISLSCSVPSLCPNEQNTAYKAANLFFKHCEIRPAVSIHIEKQIPSQAGLAGGSTDAAAVLHGLNQLFQTNLTQKQLCEIGVQIGADVPFCICGGTMLATGIGENLSPLPALPPCYIVICKPSVSVSTQEAYQKADNCIILHRPDTQILCNALKEQNLSAVSQNMKNVFQEAMALEDVHIITELMIQNNALGACMSGSGSAVFGIFETEQKALFCSNILKQTFHHVFICKPTKHGVESQS